MATMWLFMIAVALPLSLVAGGEVAYWFACLRLRPYERWLYLKRREQQIIQEARLLESHPYKR